MRSLSRRLALIAGALLCSSAALAQPFPNKPIKAVVPFAAGSATDQIGRAFAAEMSKTLGQTIVIENKPGVNGMLGAADVAKAAPDGYTILQSTAATPITAVMYKNLAYDTSKFVSVTVFTHSPLGFAANVQFAPKTVPDFIAYAKANPGKVSFGSLGVGTSHHLTGEKLKLDAGIDMVHVPYKGSGPAHADLMGGQIQVMFDNLFALMPHFKSGKLHPLAVSSAKRHRLLPDVPSLSEAGVKDFETVAWFGWLLPPGTPREIAARLNAETTKALAIPEVRQRLMDGGSDVVGNSPEDADKFLRAEIARWGAVVKAAKISAD